jgi:hypothetical protein
MEEAYKYDVAFSFLKEDERLAEQLNELLRDRLATFLYSKRQEELAGTDGEIRFNEVFGSEARIVVVLYRDNWGKTPWTRIEETALRNRGHQEGYDFAVFVPLDDPPAVPKWLPRSRIWVGLDRWGAEGAAAVIETRVQEAGGEPHAETIVERAARLARAQAFEREQEGFRRSSHGVAAGSQAAAVVMSHVQQKLAEITSAQPTMTFNVQADRNVLVAYRDGFTLHLLWQSAYVNSLDGAQLAVRLWKGPLMLRNFAHRESVEIAEQDYEFGLVAPSQEGWQEASGESRVYTSEQLAERAVMMLLDQIDAGDPDDDWPIARRR